MNRPEALPSRLRLLHLVGLWGWAGVLPLLVLLSNSISYMLPMRRVDGALFVAVLLGFAILPPVAAWALVQLTGVAWPRSSRALHLILVGGLFTAFAAYELKQFVVAGLALTLVVGLLVGILASVCYARSARFRWSLSVLAVAPVVFILFFGTATDAAKLIYAGSTTTPPVQSDSTTPVVLLVLDELPVSSLMNDGEKIDSSRFPNFARFASDATWYRNALTPAWTTTWAVPAILDGKSVEKQKLPILSDHRQNLFTLLRDSHRVHAIESVTSLCPLSVCPNRTPTLKKASGLASAFTLAYMNALTPRGAGIKVPVPGNTFGATLAALDPERSIDPSDYETGDLRLFPGPQVDVFLSGIRPVSAGSRPPLHVLHTLLPHNPYNHLPSGKLYAGHDKDQPGFNQFTEEWAGQQGAVAEGWQRHLIQTQFTDHILGRLIAKLRETDLYDRSVVVVVADHGASFVAGGNRRRPRGYNDADIALVPLFVKAPRQEQGRIVDTPVTTLDVLPTIADYADVRIPWTVDGRSLRHPPAEMRFGILDENKQIRPLDVGALLKLRRATVRRKGALFGDGKGFAAVGGGRGLLGRDVTDVAGSKSVDARVHLRDADAYGRVDTSGVFVPALVSGTITTASRVTSVAIAVNGKVVGTAMTFRNGNELAFGSVVPERSFRSGRNEIRIYAVEGEGRHASIQPLAPL